MAMLKLTRAQSIGRTFVFKNGTRVRVTGMARLAGWRGYDTPLVEIAYLSGPHDDKNNGKTGSFPWSQFRRAVTEEVAR